MKKIFSFLTFMVWLCSFIIAANADVTTTEEPTAGNAIYVAGNPDLYPVEYYNTKTEQYEGILPTIYQRISEDTGLSFSYIDAGTANRQKQLCKNNQVEIVSAYVQGKVEPAEEVELFSYAKDGKEYIICIGFTEIVSPQVVEAVQNALEQISKEEWMAASMQLSKNGQSTLPIYVYGIGAALLLALGIVIFYIVRRNKDKKREGQLRGTDELTGIGNIQYFKECYNHHISESMQNLFYVAYIAADVNKLRTYFGGEEAEEIQRFAAGMLAEAVSDMDFAARIGDGVFAICFMAPDSERAQKTMTDLVRGLNGYNEKFLREYRISFRAGIYPLGKHQTAVEKAINNARQGYNQAVRMKEPVCLCDQKLLGNVALKSRLHQKLTTAIENQEFVVYLQFTVDAKTNRIKGAEVLSRWHNAEEGVLMPGSYIEDMKTAGIIDQMDFYMFERTCQILESWKDTEYQNLYLSCNFTRVTVSMEGFVDRFNEIVSKYSFKRRNLLIELTEDSLADDDTAAQNHILAMKKRGIRIALDDLGSGFTSFGDLCDYPIDMIKIDRYIVAKSANARGNAVLKSIIKMAHELEMEVLCEGVETEAEDTTVKAAGCDYIQGFRYSRVLPLDNALEFYRKKQSSAAEISAKALRNGG